jgi:Ice-binding-like
LGAASSLIQKYVFPNIVFSFSAAAICLNRSNLLTTTGFMISAAIAAGPTSVSLATAGNFSILAKTGISVTGVTKITGDIGVSPVAATGITGFGLIKDASGTFSTSSLVVGNVYAADYTFPTPSKMTAAIGDMGTAYTNAAGRMLPSYTELYAGDLTGKTLTSGLYKWSTGVLVSAAGVTISGASTDVWIFQIAQNLSLANGAMVTLSGGAQASNIFWQVAGKVTMGTTAAMKGIILCQTAIVMSTGATLSGRALAQTAVTLDANAITNPGITNVVENGLVPQKSGFFRNNQNRSVEFTVPSNGRTTLTIYNTIGQEVATLFNGEAEAGRYNQVQFNTSGLAKGLYFSKLEFNGNVTLKEMMLVK